MDTRSQNRKIMFSILREVRKQCKIVWVEVAGVSSIQKQHIVKNSRRTIIVMLSILAIKLMAGLMTAQVYTNDIDESTKYIEKSLKQQSIYKRNNAVYVKEEVSCMVDKRVNKAGFDVG